MCLKRVCYFYEHLKDACTSLREEIERIPFMRMI